MKRLIILLFSLFLGFENIQAAAPASTKLSNAAIGSDAFHSAKSLLTASHDDNSSDPANFSKLVKSKIDEQRNKEAAQYTLHSNPNSAAISSTSFNTFQAHSAQMKTEAAQDDECELESREEVLDHEDGPPKAESYIPKLNPHYADQILKECPDKIQAIIDLLDKYKDNRPFAFKTMTKKLLLIGPAGTGKTTLGAAIASKYKLQCREFTVPLIGSEYRSSGERNIKKLFKDIEKINEPCVVIFDEMQELIKKHKNSKDVDTSVLTTFWKKLDRFAHKPIIFICAMNYIEDIPETIISRFSKGIVKVPLPNYEQRLSIINFFFRYLAKDVDFDKSISETDMAYKTDGFSHRVVRDIIEEAREIALRRPNNKILTQQDIYKAIASQRTVADRTVDERKNTLLLRAYKFCKTHQEPIKFGFGVVAFAVGTYFAYQGLAVAKEQLAHNKAVSAKQDQRAQKAQELGEEQLKHAKSTNAQTLKYQKAGVNFQKSSTWAQTGAIALGTLGAYAGGAVSATTTVGADAGLTGSAVGGFAGSVLGYGLGWIAGIVFGEE